MAVRSGNVHLAEWTFDPRSLLFALAVGSLVAVGVPAAAGPWLQARRDAPAQPVSLAVLCSSLGLASPAASAGHDPMESSLSHRAPVLGSIKRLVVAAPRPKGGPGVALAAGTPIDVLGRIRVGWLPWSRHAFLVRWLDRDRAQCGFVPASAVAIATGVPPALRVDGVDGSLVWVLPPRYGDVQAQEWQSAQVEGAEGVQSSRIQIAWLPPTLRPWLHELEAAAARYGVDPELLAIIVLVESGGNPWARSPSGAMGLMQVMPFHFQPGQNGFDVKTNIDVGARYLAQQLRTFGRRDDPDWQRSVELAAAAYNGGPGSVHRYLRGGSLPAESQAYRRWVGGMWRERRLPRSPTYEAWLAAGGRHLVAKAKGV